MDNLWVVYILVAGLSSVFFNLLSRHVLKNGDDSTSYAWWFVVFRTAIFLPFCFMSPAPQISFSNVVLFIMIGISEFFGVYIYMKMHSNSELSISSIISQLRLVWIPVIAFIFLKERLTPTEYGGIGLIILGQAAVTSPKKLGFDSGVKYAFISSILVAVNSVLAKVAATEFSPQQIVLAMGIPTILGFPIVMKEGKRRIRAFKNIAFKKISIAVVFSALTMVFMLLAIKLGPVSKVIGVFQGTTILGVFAGIVFLKEKGNLLNKIIGSMVVLVGMFLLL